MDIKNNYSTVNTKLEADFSIAIQEIKYRLAKIDSKTDEYKELLQDLEKVEIYDVSIITKYCKGKE